MKVTNAVSDRDNQQPLTSAEMEACRQFEASEMKGHALFHPRVASGDPVPDCLVFVEKTCRFGVTFLTGQYSVEDGQWYRRENDDDVPTPMGDDYNLREEAWQCAMTAKAELRRELDIGAFFIPVVVFVDMTPDDDILDEVGGRGVRLLWGLDDLPQRLLTLPKEDDLHPRLNVRFIAREVEVLSPRPASAPPEEEQLPLDLGAGPLVLQRVDTVHIHVTIVTSAGGGDGDNPLLSVQVQ